MVRGGCPGLLLLGDRKLDVHGGKKGKDVGPQHGNENLKELEDKAEGEGTRTKKFQRAVQLEKEKLGSGEEQNENEVADDHVHHEPERERDRPNDKRGEELHHTYNHLQSRWHPGRKQCVTEEVFRALLDTRIAAP